jgi:hypothetical protein
LNVGNEDWLTEWNAENGGPWVQDMTVRFTGSENHRWRMVVTGVNGSAITYDLYDSAVLYSAGRVATVGEDIAVIDGIRAKYTEAPSVGHAYYYQVNILAGSGCLTVQRTVTAANFVGNGAGLTGINVAGNTGPAGPTGPIGPAGPTGSGGGGDSYWSFNEGNLRNGTTGNVGVNIGPSAQFHVGANPGPDGGIKITLLQESATQILSYANMTFGVPGIDVAGQVFHTASNYSGAGIPASALVFKSNMGPAVISAASSAHILTGGVERIFVDTYGYVGIGTNVPTCKLDVAGNVAATQFIGDGSRLTGISGGVTGDSFWRATSPGETGIINTNNGGAGYVGIGVAAPHEHLDVGGTIKGLGFKFPTGAFPGAVLMCADVYGTMYWGSGYTGATGSTGATGPTGPTGPTGDVDGGDVLGGGLPIWDGGGVTGGDEPIIDGGVEVGPTGTTGVDGGGATGGGLPLIDGGVEVSGGGVTGATGPEIDGGGITGGGAELLDGGGISEPDLDGGGVV